MFNLPPTTRNVAVLLTLVFAVLRLLPDTTADRVYQVMALVPAWFQAAPRHLDDPYAWAILASPLTHGLVHVDFLHFIVNAGMLVAFGSAVERLLGARRFLLILLASLLGGAAAQLWADWGQLIPIIGASGGISGVIGAMIRILAADPVRPQNRRLAMSLLVMTLVMNGAFALIGDGFFNGSGIAWQAHLGGLAVGLLLTDFMLRVRKA